MSATPAPPVGGLDERPGKIDAVPVRHPGRWVVIAIITVLVAMFVHMLLTNPAFNWSFVFEAMIQSPVLRGLVAGTLSAVVVAFLSKDAFGSASLGVLGLSGQGASFVAASTAFVVDIVLSVVVSLATQPKPSSELKGLVYSETPREDLVDPEEATMPWFQRTLPLAGIALVLVIILNVSF